MGQERLGKRPRPNIPRRNGDSKQQKNGKKLGPPLSSQVHGLPCPLVSPTQEPGKEEYACDDNGPEQRVIGRSSGLFR